MFLAGQVQQRSNSLTLISRLAENFIPKANDSVTTDNPGMGKFCTDSGSLLPGHPSNKSPWTLEIIWVFINGYNSDGKT